MVIAWAGRVAHSSFWPCKESGPPLSPLKTRVNENSPGDFYLPPLSGEPRPDELPRPGKNYGKTIPFKKLPDVP